MISPLRMLYFHHDDDNKEIRSAAKHGHVAELERLLQEGLSDPGARDNYAIQFASLRGHVDCVNLLLKSPLVNPAANENYAIRIAAKHGHAKVVRALLRDSRVDPTANGNDAILAASAHGRIDVVRLLVEDGRVEAGDAIERASINGHYEVAQFLLQHTPPQRVDNFTICLAAQNGHANIVKLLIDKAHLDPSFHGNSCPCPRACIV